MDRSGEVSGDMLDGESSRSPEEMPMVTGAELPVNQPLNPPLRSSSFTTPSRSPVSVGMNPSSTSICVFSLLGLCSGLLPGIRKLGNNAVRDL